MGAFYVFKIVQMVPNRAKQEQEKYVFISGKKKSWK